MAVTLLALFTPAAVCATLEFHPLTQTVNVGDPAVVDLVASGFGNGVPPALGGFTGLQIAFNPSVVQPSLVVFSNRLGDVSLGEAIFSSNTFFPGMVLLDAVSLLDPASLMAIQTSGTGDFTIATLTFQAIAAGVSPLGLSVSAVSDELGNPLSPTLENGSITVSGSGNVPEPATWLMIAGGIGAIRLLRRK